MRTTYLFLEYLLEINNNKLLSSLQKLFRLSTTAWSSNCNMLHHWHPSVISLAILTSYENEVFLWNARFKKYNFAVIQLDAWKSTLLAIIVLIPGIPIRSKYDALIKNFQIFYNYSKHFLLNYNSMPWWLSQVLQLLPHSLIDLEINVSITGDIQHFES